MVVAMVLVVVTVVVEVVAVALAVVTVVVEVVAVVPAVFAMVATVVLAAVVFALACSGASGCDGTSSVSGTRRKARCRAAPLPSSRFTWRAAAAPRLVAQRTARVAKAAKSPAASARPPIF